MGLFSRKKAKVLPHQRDGPPPIPVNSRPPLPPPRHHTSPSQYHSSQSCGITGPDGPCPASQPVGYLPPPSGWNSGSSPPPYPYQQQPPPQQAPIVVNQHYYLLPAPPSQDALHKNNSGINGLCKLNLGSAVNLANQVMTVVLPDGPSQCQLVNQGAETMKQMYERFNDLMTLIDRDRYSGNEKDLFTYDPTLDSSSTVVTTTSQGQLAKPKKNQATVKGSDNPKGQAIAAAGSVVSGSYFAKVDLYANSRLPMNLPPLKLYIPTWPLLCLAAQYSERVYEKSRGAERDVHVDADYRTGTKAMVIKSVPMDELSTIVFAIRGTVTFMDWAVNLKTAPTSPAGFLDDASNYCHSGFLSVAKKMIRPVASRLRRLLQEDPGRSSYSLLITGHSAGGAVASLLYAHMLSTSGAAESELNVLTGCFKRVHCVTFGAPPISMLPLRRPEGLNKSLFLSFVNEGDPVARADKAYVKSLLELLATPAPVTTTLVKPASSSSLRLPGPRAPKSNASKGSLVSTRSWKSSKSSKSSKSCRAKGLGGAGSAPVPAGGPTWKVPPSTLSNAGRVVVLRSGDPNARLKGKKTAEERLNEGVVAQIATDEQLRAVIWGDPVCHVMRLYAARLEILAVGAVTAQGC